jgi:hypothetical protein
LEGGIDGFFDVTRVSGVEDSKRVRPLVRRVHSDRLASANFVTTDVHRDIDLRRFEFSENFLQSSSLRRPWSVAQDGFVDRQSVVKITEVHAQSLPGKQKALASAPGLAKEARAKWN